MAGILNSKERVIDFIITPEGRRQMVDGRMRIEFATLTDQHTFYTSSHPDKVADDASERIFFETHSSTTDIIVPEIDAGDEENNIQPFRAGSFLVDGKTFAEGTYDDSGPAEYYNFLSGSAIIEKAGGLTDSLAKHFEGLRILGTEDHFSNFSHIKLSASTGSFIITDQDLLQNQGKGVYLKDLNPADSDGESPGTPDGIVDLRTSPSIYSDPRFAGLPNYMYLPPRNLPGEGQREDDPSLIMGSYPSFSADTENPKRPGDKHDLEELLRETFKKRQSVIFDFEETSIDNNIVAQIFEFSRDGVDKLSIIDAGATETFEGDRLVTVRRVFFVGKLLRDSEGVQTFMNIFTLVFSNKDAPMPNEAPLPRQDHTGGIISGVNGVLV